MIWWGGEKGENGRVNTSWWRNKKNEWANKLEGSYS
jgi:hypothetical protein